MSFSSNVKSELCREMMSRRSGALAEAYGVLLFCNTFTASLIRIITESQDFAARLPRLFKKAFGFAFDLEPEPEAAGKLHHGYGKDPQDLFRFRRVGQKRRDAACELRRSGGR